MLTYKYTKEEGGSWKSVDISANESVVYALLVSNRYGCWTVETGRVYRTLFQGEGVYRVEFPSGKIWCAETGNFLLV